MHNVFGFLACDVLKFWMLVPISRPLMVLPTVAETCALIRAHDHNQEKAAKPELKAENLVYF